MITVRFLIAVSKQFLLVVGILAIILLMASSKTVGLCRGECERSFENRKMTYIAATLLMTFSNVKDKVGRKILSMH